MRIRVVNKRKVSDFLGVIKTSKKFPGKEAVRESAAKSLAKRHPSKSPLSKSTQ